MLKLCLASFTLLLGSTLCSAQSSAPLLFSRATVNQTHIAFSYAGDIWLVEKGGGDARRITTDPNEENYPVFSPDGTQLAFSRQVGNDWDIFIMPATGGEARRLTYMPEDDLVMNWTPDGKSILFLTHRDEESTYRLYTIPTDGVFPTALPLPQAFEGSYSNDGKRIAYAPRSPFGNWRFYRGGMSSTIWVCNLADGGLERMPRGNYNDKFPMWVADKIYFVSDRTGNANLFVYDQTTKQTKQLTTFEKYGIRLASAGAGSIVFIRDGHLYLYDLASGGTRVVDVRVNLDSSEAKPRPTSAVRNIEWASLSSSGDRLILGARGEALTFNLSSGELKNLTQSSAVAERYPALSPDGRWLAYFSDESGEYQLYVRAANGEGETRKIAIEKQPSFYRELTWSPDSKKLAFTDKRLSLWFADVAQGAARRVDTSQYSFQEQWFPKWSPDSRWLTYSKHLRNRVRTVFIYGIEEGRARQITDGRTTGAAPVFDRSGKYLYFMSSANAGTSEFGWGVLNGTLARPLVTRTLHALVLQDGQPAPLLPNGQPNPDVRFEEAAGPVRIDFDGLARRVIDLPLAPRDYSELVTTDRAGVLFVLVNEWPKSPAPLSNPTQALYVYDLSKPPKFEKLVEEIDGYDISRDGSRLLYVKKRDWFLVPATTAPVKPDEGKIDLKGLEITVDPRAEWRQMYREAWRIMRDWFYDPNYHGQNLAELERHFAEYLPNVVRRTDLNNLMSQMLGYISVSHLAVGGGDAPPTASQPSRIGLLGADYEIAQGRYRFKRIYASSRFNDPNGSVGAPLDRPGINVREGEYLLAVDGQTIEASKNIYSYFVGKAGKPTKITVGPNPDGDGSRQLTVFPTAGENRLRRAAWAEQNRRRVEELSGGRLGYIYVESYGGGIMDFMRGLTGYSDKQGVIIDQRFNGGGITPDYLIEWLKRRPIYYYTFREGDDIPTPVNPGPGTSVLITNEFNGSAAETFAFMFKLGRVGQIVGWRTYGAGIGPYVFTPDLIDGGFIQLPNRAAYDPSGASWGIENVGVVPDVEVEITPRDWMAGRDPQLERAVEVALDGLKKNVPLVPKKPKYPVHP